MKVFITGSNSFIGNQFLSRYSEKFEIVEVDTIKNKVEDILFSKGDIVFHVAAIVHQSKSISSELYFKVNCDLAFEMAKKAKACGIRQFVFMSTVKVYGEYTDPGESWNENSSCNPSDPYGESKLYAERRLHALNDENFIISVIRTPVVYGPGVKGNILNIMKLIDKFPILPFGGIKNKRTMVFVGNLIALIDRVIELKKPGIFLAGDAYPVSTSDLVKEIKTNLHKKRLILPIPSFLTLFVKKLWSNLYYRLFGDLLINNSYTVSSLEFQPPYSFQNGIKEMVAWYKNDQ